MTKNPTYDELVKRIQELEQTHCTFQDITKRNRTEEELRGDEKKYRRLYAQSERQNRTLTAINAISQSVNQSLDLEQVLNDTLDRIIELFKPHSANIRLLDNRTQELVLAAHKGLGPEDLNTITWRLKFERNVFRYAIESQKAIVIEDVITDPRTAGTASFCEKIGCRTVVVIPLHAKNKILGQMNIRGREPGAFTADEIQLFTAIGHQVGTAIENANLFAQDKQHTKELSVLNIISQTINQTLDLDIILNSALEKVIELLNADCGFLRLLSEDRQKLVLTAHKGFTAEQISKLSFSKKYGEGGNWKILLSDQVKHLVLDQNYSFQQKINSFGLRIGARDVILFPLKSENNMLGTMAIYSLTPRVFTKQEIELTAIIGSQIGIAIEKAKLYQEKEITIKALSETREKLQQAQKMESIGTLAGGIAHDFNNILSPIMIHSEMAMMELPSGSPLQQNMKEIFKAGERAGNLVKQILTFARKQQRERVPLSVSQILKEAIKLLRSTLPTTIDIRYDIRPEQDTVFADPTQMNQIIMNLCTNAAHAMEEKGGTLEVILTSEDLDSESADAFPDLEPGRYVKLTVKDTGHGIGPRITGKIFDPYFTTKEVGKGTGMGLALVHGIVKSYRGNVTVETAVGKGTCFDIYLPLVEADADVALETTTDSVPLPTGMERILFVDDEKAAVDVVQVMLKRLGYDVTARNSSIEALETFRNHPDGYDLIITDMTMPNMTGKDLAGKLLSIRPDLPIILCTGFSEQIDQRRAEEMGIRAFVMKPIVMRQIAGTIREVLEN